MMEVDPDGVSLDAQSLGDLRRAPAAPDVLAEPVSQCTLPARASCARAAGPHTTSPSRLLTFRIATGLRATCLFLTAPPYKLANAASSRSHFDPPTRPGFSLANRRQCS